VNTRHVRGPYNRSTQTYKRVLPMLVCAMALRMLLATHTSAQTIEDTIVLPDTFGPLPGPLHMAYDDDSAHARLYIGGEADSGGVLVVDLLTCDKLARIATGPVSDLAVSVPRGKLYVARADADSILIVDCDNYNEVGGIALPSRALALLYNHANDRIYAVGTSVVVIDCVGDTVVHTIGLSPAPDSVALLALDTLHNHLYVGSEGATFVVDCGSDSVTDILPGLRGPAAMVMNPTVGKLYYTAADTLFVVSTASDSICARLYYGSLRPLLACDPVHGRTYFQDGPWFTAMDCATESIIYVHWRYPPATGLECDPVSDRVYYREGGAMSMYDGATLVRDTWVLVTEVYSCRLQRLPRLGYMVALFDTATTHVFDCRSDSLIGTVTTTGQCGDVCVGANGAKLYMTGGYDITVVDCSLNIVTSHIQSQACPFIPTYSATYNRLYVTCSDSLVSVYDCTADTLLKRIPVTESKNAALYHPGLHKLYLFEQNRAWEPETISVIQCGPDTVCGLVPLPSDWQLQAFIVSEQDRLWCIGAERLVIIDCLNDSIIVDTLWDWGVTTPACVNFENRRIYLDRNSYELQIVHMDSLSLVVSIPGPGTGHGSPLVYAPLPRKVYWFAEPYIWVLDSETDSVLRKVDCGVGFRTAMLDRTGTYVYCFGEWDSLLYCIDTRTDSIISRTPVPNPQWERLVPNERDHRLYLEGWFARSGMPVLRDSIVKPGVVEFSSLRARLHEPPAIVRQSGGLLISVECTVFDAAGRSLAKLREGWNRLDDLPPGIYFVREEPQATGLKPQAVRKIVVTR
jgi:DNA-binding beta-propeller fold protein YncE